MTDGSGLDINTSQNAWLAKMVRSGEVTCIQETTKERIFIAKTLSKEFGLRIFNAAFVPYYMTLAQVKQGVPKTRKCYYVCAFNHVPGELEGVLNGAV